MKTPQILIAYKNEQGTVNILHRVPLEYNTTTEDVADEHIPHITEKVLEAVEAWEQRDE